MGLPAIGVSSTMAFIFIMSILLSNVALSPIFDYKDEEPVSRRNSTISGTVGEVVCVSGEKLRSDDSCLPWCTCRQGRRVCARIECSNVEIPDHCRLVRARGRCCPKVVCETSNLTTSVSYSLPWIVLPPNMFEANTDTSQ